MIHKILTGIKSIVSLPLLKQTPKYKMETAIFQKENDKVVVSFCFQNDTFNLKKKVEFNRNLSESLVTFLNIVETKLKAELRKKQKKLQKKENNAPIPDIKPLVLCNNKPLPPNLVLQEIFSSKINGELKLRILEYDYNVVINAPTIEIIKLPDEIKVGCPVYPLKLRGRSFNIEYTTFKWYKSLYPNTKWIECGKDYCYTPTEKDTQNFLKLLCTPGNELKLGPVFEVISKSVVNEFKGAEEIRKRHEFTKQRTGDNEFRIVCYNILADNYTTTYEAKNSLFTYCDKKILNKHYRRDLLMLELTGYNADIICLQEVQSKMFSYLTPVLKNQHLKGIFQEKDSNKEGCAIFYNSQKFQISHFSHYNFSSEILSNPLFEDFKDEIVKNEKLLSRLMNLPTLIQVVVLECLKNPSNLFVLGNTHLYFHPDADHIRLLQGLVGFKILLNIAEEQKKKHPDKKVSVFLIGDFNSSPDSGFHQFLNDGSVSENHPGWKQNENEVIENISCSHYLNMKSACGTPQYTNYTTLFKGCLDYIYFETEHVELKQAVPCPSEETLSRQTAIPSEFFPSDHIALIADLKFKKM